MPFWSVFIKDHENCSNKRVTAQLSMPVLNKLYKTEGHFVEGKRSLLWYTLPPFNRVCMDPWLCVFHGMALAGYIAGEFKVRAGYGGSKAD